jgi:4'-phosphopantetheinyl transferase
MLRLILSGFTGQDPHAVAIVTGQHGKPYLADGGPHFSLSHAADVALVAVSAGGPVGVDVERIRPDVGIDVFARELVAPPEADRIDALPGDERTRAWFQAWTRLEAAAKASGDGLRDAASNCSQRATLGTCDLRLDAPFVGAVAVA